MILVFDTTLLTVQEVQSLYIDSKEKTTIGESPIVWYRPCTWKLKPKITTITEHTLIINYTRTDGKNYKYTSEYTDLSVIQKMAREILKQVKMQTLVQDQELIDKLFENALLEDT